MNAAEPKLAGLIPRLACMVYEGLILVALLLAATLAFSLAWGALFGAPAQGWDLPRSGAQRHVLQAWLTVALAGYFVIFWCRGGQTLPMKTWRIRVTGPNGANLRPGLGLARFLLALLGLALGGLGYAWALVDRDRQFLHDRLLGSRLVSVPRTPATA